MSFSSSTNPDQRSNSSSIPMHPNNPDPALEAVANIEDASDSCTSSVPQIDRSETDPAPEAVANTERSTTDLRKSSPPRSNRLAGDPTALDAAANNDEEFNIVGKSSPPQANRSATDTVDLEAAVNADDESNLSMGDVVLILLFLLFNPISITTLIAILRTALECRSTC
ncbi:hypothetical protein BDQ17DRAFT_1430777 [Cyathus striatus]|nr:hypothetical protein BDQ17DRAFT_1430777 [Cyathus striatus]